MKKDIILVAFIFFTITLSYGQNNDYFGSVIIPKNEYLIRMAETNAYLNVSNSNEVSVLEKKSQNKFMFIPAGDGYYYIKLQSNGHYLQVAGGNLNKGNQLQAALPERNELQKFKVISKGNGQFKFIATNNLAIDSLPDKTGKLRIWDDNGSKNQTFEILEAKTLEKLSAD